MASAGRPLNLREDLAVFGGYSPLVKAAAGAGLTIGEVAREILAGCPAKVALAWLLAIARKRSRLRSTGAVFRSGCRAGSEPALVDLVAADRLLRGAAGETLPAGNLYARRAAGQIRQLTFEKSAVWSTEVPEWQKRRAEMELAKQAERRRLELRLRRMVEAMPPGPDRASAEKRLAQMVA